MNTQLLSRLYARLTLVPWLVPHSGYCSYWQPGRERSSSPCCCICSCDGEVSFVILGLYWHAFADARDYWWVADWVFEASEPSPQLRENDFWCPFKGFPWVSTSSTPETHTVASWMVWSWDVSSHLTQSMANIICRVYAGVQIHEHEDKSLFVQPITWAENIQPNTPEESDPEYDEQGWLTARSKGKS